MPNEQNGFKGSPDNAGQLMFQSIGQFDTYSTLQLAQYVSTIANGGYRMEPHMVKEIGAPLENELGPVVQEIQPKVLNRLDLEKGWIERVQLGFKKVTQETIGGTGASYFKGKPYSPAGKTGTAEAFYDGPLRQYRMADVTTLSFVGYAPAENPEIAMAVLVPWAYQGGSSPRSNMKISERVFDTYFELKKQRAMNGTADQNSTSETSNVEQPANEEVGNAENENTPQG